MSKCLSDVNTATIEVGDITDTLVDEIYSCDDSPMFVQVSAAEEQSGMSVKLISPKDYLLDGEED